MSGCTRRSGLAAALTPLALGPWMHVRATEPLQVVYPAPESPRDERFGDMVALLREALTRTEARHGPFVLRPHTQHLTQPRQLLELELDQSLSVQWSATTLEKEQRLLPVRFPTRRGLLGFRLAFIQRQRQAEFRRVRNLEDLRRFTLGQGATWVDTEILRSQGLRVEIGHYEGLFKMLAAGRFDLFPRGVNEIFTEFTARQLEAPALAIEDSLALHYPMPYYFFFNRRNAALARRVESGLQTMLRDGSFEQHFWTFHGPAVRRARLSERRLIRLANPYLPPLTPMQQLPLWFNPERVPGL